MTKSKRVSLRNVKDPPRLRKPGRRERVAARQADAMRLRVAGVGFAAIGRQLGVSTMQAWRDVRRALDETVGQRDGDADSYRRLELMRLDAMTTAVWPAAQKGDVESVRAVVRIGERRARLLGLDAATSTRLEMKGSVMTEFRIEDRYAHMTDAELAERLDQVREELKRTIADEQLRAMTENAPLVPVFETPEQRYERTLNERRARRTN